MKQIYIKDINEDNLIVEARNLVTASKRQGDNGFFHAILKKEEY